MKNYNKLMILVISILAIGILCANLVFLGQSVKGSQLYLVEVNRLMDQMQSAGEITTSDMAACDWVTGVEFLPNEAGAVQAEAFFEDKNYVIRPLYVDGECSGYLKFTYENRDAGRGTFLLTQNIVLLLVSAAVILILVYIKIEIVRPMYLFQTLPEALAKGDFTTPLSERRRRFFGRFLWGLDMLRETLLTERQHRLAVEKEKSKTALALSHDIKTPLGAILLCSKALREELYQDKEKQNALLIKIDDRAMEIQRLVAQLQQGASEEMLDLLVEDGDFYLDEVIDRAEDAYRWRMELTGTELIIDLYTNCLLRGDANRAFEALCNLLENAVKYGDGRRVALHFSREEGCQLITVTNTGNSLPAEDLVHLFDSFWRGSNAKDKPGNGLGLYIARRLITKMGGEAFAAIRGNEIDVTLVFKMG